MSAGHVLSLPELADALVRWMDAAGLETAAWVGQSFGCQIVAEAAVSAPGAGRAHRAPGTDGRAWQSHQAGTARPVRAERRADGEPLGTTPVELVAVPDGLQVIA